MLYKWRKVERCRYHTQNRTTETFLFLTEEHINTKCLLLLFSFSSLIFFLFWFLAFAPALFLFILNYFRPYYIFVLRKIRNEERGLRPKNNKIRKKNLAMRPIYFPNSLPTNRSYFAMDKLLC